MNNIAKDGTKKKRAITRSSKEEKSNTEK